MNATEIKADESARMNSESPLSREAQGVFGDVRSHQIKYQTLSWITVTAIMCTEIVAGGTLTLPQALGVVGIVPGLLVLIFCGVFALYTALLLVDFKLNHPQVYSMGDVGYILFSPINLGFVGREILLAGTLFFSITSVGGAALFGQFALATLSDSELCNLTYTGIVSAAIFCFSVPRTLDRGLGWMCMLGFVSVLISCIVAMAGASAQPAPNRVIGATRSQTFYTAFLTITNPVIAYTGHFMFFPLMSEMKRPQDAKKSALFLQTYATLFYITYAVVTYYYLGEEVESPSFLSLSTTWAKIAWGLFFPNIMIAGALYNHISAKIIFVRIFRDSHHLYSHTCLSWTVWIGLLFVMNGVGFVLALGVPFFSFLAGIAAALFASWFTYGLAGVFWWHDTHFLGHHRAWKGGQDSPRGWRAVKRHKIQFGLAVAAIVSTMFICVAGTYAIIKGIVVAYEDGSITTPFSC